MKSSTNIFQSKLLSPDPKIRKLAIDQLAKSKDSKLLKLLMQQVLSKRIGNMPSLAIKAIGDSGNDAGISILIEIYGQVNDVEKKLIIESISKLGAFSSHMDGNVLHKNIQEQLWPLLFGLNSDQFRQMHNLNRKQFEEKLESASRITAHWKKK